MEDSNPDEVADPRSWSRSFSNEELRNAQENDLDLKYLLLRKTETSPSKIELSLSSPAVKHWWNSNELLSVMNEVLYYTWIETTSKNLLLLVPNA